MTADATLLQSPEWNAYIRSAELADQGHYNTPLYGTAGYWYWIAETGGDPSKGFLYTDEWRAYMGLPAYTPQDQWNAFVAAGAPGWSDFINNAATPATTPPGGIPGGPNGAPTSTGTPSSLGINTASGPDFSAAMILSSALADMGLAALGGWAWDKWKAGEPIEQIMLELRDTAEYKTRFPAMDQLAHMGHAISEAAYINLEETYKQIMRAAGLPSGFFDQPADFTRLIGGEVSPTELQNRIDTYVTLAYQMPREVLDEFARQSGFNDWFSTGWSMGDLTAFLINPDVALPVIQTNLAKAQIGGAAEITGYGRIDPYDIARLQQLGVDYNTATQGFSTLVNLEGLFSPLAGTTEQAIGRSTQIAAALGSDARAQDVIEARAASRKSPFQGGGTVAGSQRGQSGAGTSQ